jgi:LmbE family N-acetylglucosaminyl deacetylase
MRRRVKRMLDAALGWKCRPVGALALEGAAIVFSPHYDDEALACGGTIIRRVALGARTCVVFMTDGAGSHRHLMPAPELTRLRKAEALAASARAGLGENDLVHLAYPDGGLSQKRDEGVEAVAGILTGFQPDVVFTPYVGEAPVDHRATTDIVLAAMERTGRRTPMLQYAVWLWNQWPRVGPEVGSRRHLPRLWWRALADNARLLRDFDSYVDISDVIEEKRSYLGEYRSQLTRLVDDPRWMTLGDVSGGEFLRCFFTPREYFSRRS